MQKIAVAFVQGFPQGIMRVFNALLRLHDQYVLAFNVPASLTLQVVSVMLTLLLAHEYAVEH